MSENKSLEKTQLTQKQIRQMLSEGECIVEFVKKNGESRVMRCTTNTGMSMQNEGAVVMTDRVTPELLNQVRVIDMEKKQWRSFLFDHLVSIVKV